MASFADVENVEPDLANRVRAILSSTTNAVLLNGAALPDHDAGITLQDGDRLEMGAVMFVFHAR